MAHYPCRGLAGSGVLVVSRTRSLMLVTDVVLCEDGHAQERSLLGQILEIVRAKDVCIDDPQLLQRPGSRSASHAAKAFFVVRQHALATLPPGIHGQEAGMLGGSRPARSSSRRCG